MWGEAVDKKKVGLNLGLRLELKLGKNEKKDGRKGSVTNVHSLKHVDANDSYNHHLYINLKKKKTI